MLPLVTVYIPTFNRLDLLKRAVKSVVNQTYQNLEIIIVDDCSTDGTHKYLDDLSRNDKRIKYFIKEKNSGACLSRNIAIKNATGEYITGLDDDDYFDFNRIELFVKNSFYLEKYKFICTKYKYKTHIGLKKSKIDFFKPKSIRGKDLLSINYVNNQIFTKTYLLRTNLFNTNMKAWQDLYTWYGILRVNGRGKILNDYSYIVDTSHPHERITTGKIEKIENAYFKFCEDFNLSKTQQLILRNHLSNYSREYKSMLSAILSLINSFNLYSLLVFIKFLIK